MALLTTLYPWFKIAHILSFTAWMAGMLYLPRLFVYHHGAEAGGEAARTFTVMEEKLLRLIMNPAMIATWLFGLLLVAGPYGWHDDGWFLIKFVAVILMSGVHGFYAASRKKFAAGEKPRTAKFWRMINEVPFLLLAIIVAMVILKPLVN
ncbi:protoporphyrinogen oxidase HemJ [Parvularcula maris]|uniref:Protoporphyrinogen IX oxidase n=1 Tax=Parvularcula maris TaxID=2965077 RepID=A0A9X2L673_9PROT|nr:protoporphyrinogen oxidase HemJ [Parvularcula maris]MCQ8183820.1 protoporphyrinogen oxidase HemJ [Parvularcula maris]